jgi:hypothetical protein
MKDAVSFLATASAWLVAGLLQPVTRDQAEPCDFGQDRRLPVATGGRRVDVFGCDLRLEKKIVQV